MNRYLLWGRGDSLQPAYRSARIAGWLVGVVVASNALALVLYHSAPDKLEPLAGPLYVARTVVVLLAAAMAIRALHWLSALAERAEIYGGMIRGELVRRPACNCSCSSAGQGK